jgi:tellurite resistance protein TehA-like permease
VPGRLTYFLNTASPASGAVVMGTGIVSTALALDHQDTLSSVLLVVAAVTWVLLAVSLGLRLLRSRHQVRAEAHAPAALTGVAATAVLGARAIGLGGWDVVAEALLALAAGAWVALLPGVLGHWRTPVTGVAFMTSVATQSLSVLAAALAVGERAGWLLYAAAAIFLLGLVLYAFVLRGFDFGELLRGRGDHWITGGALAIGTLSAARIALAIPAVHEMTSLHDVAKVLSLILWSLSAAWLVALVIVELARPRLRYDIRRWATVFPVGMYAASSFDVGAAARVSAITHFARVWVWVALGVWVVVFLGLFRRALHRPS